MRKYNSEDILIIIFRGSNFCWFLANKMWESGKRMKWNLSPMLGYKLGLLVQIQWAAAITKESVG